MAIYRWLYANAKMEGNRKDYFVRVCDSELDVYRRILVELSDRMLSTGKRRGKAEKQICWFAGYISKEVYMVAVGGGQEELIGIVSGKYRTQHCVLGYGFTEKDIRLYKKEESMFEPLKEILREIQRTGTEEQAKARDMIESDFSIYKEGTDAFYSGNDEEDIYNIQTSSEETDRKLWVQSLKYPVMLGLISVDDGKRLLRQFPTGYATVIENVNLQYNPEAEQERKKEGSTEEQRLHVGTDGIKKSTASRPIQSNPARGTADRKGKKTKESTIPENERLKKTIKEAYDWIARQGLPKRKESIGRQKQEKIAECAYWCKSRIPLKQVAAVDKAIEKLRTADRGKNKEDFFRQIRYSGYMLLWKEKQEKGGHEKNEQEIFFFIEAWARSMKDSLDARKKMYSW